ADETLRSPLRRKRGTSRVRRSVVASGRTRVLCLAATLATGMVAAVASPAHSTSQSLSPRHPGALAAGAGVVRGDGAAAFTSNRDGNSEIYATQPDGSVQTDLTNNPAADTQPAWSPDGSLLAFTSTRNGTAKDITMNAHGSN